MDNKEQLSIFIQDEQGKLRNYVRRYLRETSELQAEDVIQDVALNIYSKLDFSAPIENVAAFFYRSLRNRIIDLIRKRKKYYSQSIDEEMSIVVFSQ